MAINQNGVFVKSEAIKSIHIQTVLHDIVEKL